MLKCKIGITVFAVLIGLVFTGCIKPNKNRAPSRAEINCPKTARVGNTVPISVVATDRDSDKIAYQLNFGDGTQSEWSELLESGVAKTFLYTFNETGIYGIYGIASDEHRKNSGWGEKAYIEVIALEVGSERLFFCVPEHADFLKVRLFAATADFARIKNVGATIIHTYGTNWLPDSGQYFLDNAEKHGLKVLYCLTGLIHHPIKIGQPWNRENCRILVEKFDTHPALWGWYLLDEPDLGVVDPTHGVPLWLQKEITDAFRSWTDKPLVIATAGGAGGYHLIDFSLYDLIIPDAYVFDGDDDCWGMKPLDYLDFAASTIRDYIDEHEITTQFMFMFQCDSSPATSQGRYGTKIPLGQIKNQFDAIYSHNLFIPGVAMYAWDGGDFCPNCNDEIYNEIKQFFFRIKVRIK